MFKYFCRSSCSNEVYNAAPVLLVHLIYGVHLAINSPHNFAAVSYHALSCNSLLYKMIKSRLLSQGQG